jgi:hypothetical protein
MNDINKLEKEKLLQLLECNIEELDILIRKSSEIPQESDNSYDILLKILQQGFNIREAVLENKEVESGISIHFVNQNYDEGEIIFQESFILSPDESLNSLTTKVHELEQSLFPKIIEKTLFSL